MSKPTTDDEVLALAEKIKQQRKINAEYSKAYQKLDLLEGAIDKNGLTIRHVEVSFGTLQRSYINTSKVCLPEEAAGDLIQFLQNYIAEKNV